MPRDQKLKRAFEVADDGMQGVIGYFYYVCAAQYIAKEQIIVDYLPHGGVLENGSFKRQFCMKMFHEWIRFYDPVELVSTMRAVFTPYHIRTCMLGIVSIFEAYLSNSIDRLVGTKKVSVIKGGYKKRLEWVFPFILTSKYGNKSMQDRRPNLCLDIDHARRIRNLWMHNNGNFTILYKKDSIKIDNHEPIIVPEFNKFTKSKKSKIPFPVNISLFETISRSHIEALHHIHNMLQVKYFGQKRWYDYKQEKKGIE